jgi:DNA-3-methyladenine glycosylase II
LTKDSFDLNKTCEFASFYRGKYATDIYDNQVYKRLIDTPSGPILASAAATGTSSLEITIKSQNSDISAENFACSQLLRIIGADQNPSDFYEFAASDDILKPLVNLFKGLHIPQTLTVYEGLITAIIGQQINTNVASMLRSLIIELYGVSTSINGGTFYSFPTPQSIAEIGVEELVNNKFSRRKAEYIHSISEKEATGQIDLESTKKMTIEEATETLTCLRGVGPWTIQWLLIRSLGFSDGFPSGDLALQKILGESLNTREKMTSEEALAFSQRWTPYRSWATTFIFAALRNGIKL